MGRYIPPSALDAGLTNANVASGKGHALGSRARKINQGILTVRFEMPFAVWCTSCRPQPTLIAQGVRFNAEKKKVGNYHSTPILSFRMKHGACGGWLEIRTDPKNAQYVVHEGGKRRDYGGEDEDKNKGPLGEILTEEERERRRNDAFAAFEGKVEEKEKGKVEGQRVEELLEDRTRHWEDPYLANQRLRRTFRADRKIRHRNEREKEAIRDRMGLDIELLDATEADERAAKLVSFGEDPREDVALLSASKPLFLSESDTPIDLKALHNNSRGKRHKPGAAVSKTRLQEALRNNTRAAIDPFGTESTPRRQITNFKAQGSRSTDDEARIESGEEGVGEVRHRINRSGLTQALVSYDSD